MLRPYDDGGRSLDSRSSSVRPEAPAVRTTPAAARLVPARLVPARLVPARPAGRRRVPCDS
ncbi:hypothetical protein [Myceligenerans pegani]|uniref:Uncharacterized protein n=1 Tax=Myceligenerans pegani TaxID=2776917 RepID=A0ABR9N0G6_9MICO|nr:hypothetical protein [Myceligenerans sp. TRM 65318]MBE1876502.1 hypothetical protein [Myceligenerans sp. TRM 65318]MBE3018773.1 hypothetical protein [Myceligenerans sp. TRM 65318]